MLNHQKVRDAIAKLHEYISGTTGYNEKDATSEPWFVVRNDEPGEEDGIFIKHEIVYSTDEPFLYADQNYAALMHPRVGDKVANLLSKLDQHIGSGMAYSSTVVTAMEELAEELLRDIYAEPSDDSGSAGESAENSDATADAGTD